MSTTLIDYAILYDSHTTSLIHAPS